MTARLDYGFARRHGVILLDTDDGAPECAHLAKAPLSALLEAQREQDLLLRQMFKDNSRSTPLTEQQLEELRALGYLGDG